MVEPITVATAVITGLVGAYKAYTEYKAATATVTEQNAPPPARSPEAAQGEQSAPIIRAGVEQHGEAKDVRVIENFEDDPETYEDALQKMLARVAARSQPFAQQLQTLAQQANIQTGGVQGNLNVSGQGKIIGTAVGVNEGTISGTYTVRPDDHIAG